MEGDLAPAAARLAPRPYQAELLERAAENDTIVYLATGSGKTLIAAELLRRLLPGLKAGRRAAVLLAPSIGLALQQAGVMADSGLDAEAFVGDDEPDRCAAPRCAAPRRA